MENLMPRKCNRILLLGMLVLWPFLALGLPESTDRAEYLVCTTGACKFRIEGEEVWLKPKGVLLPRWIGTKQGNGWCWAERSLSRQLESYLTTLFSKAKRIEVSGIEKQSVPVTQPVGKVEAHLADIMVDGHNVAEGLDDHALGIMYRYFTGPKDETFWCIH